LVPHAKDIQVAAILDTILALWRVFSDILAGVAVWMFQFKERLASLLDHCEVVERLD
jgi:hypothetical protein